MTRQQRHQHDRLCALQGVRRPEGQDGLRLHLDRRAGGRAAPGLVQAVRGVHRRQDQVRGLQGVRGPAPGARQGRQRRRTSPIVPQPGLLKTLVATGKAVKEAPPETVGQRRQELAPTGRTTAPSTASSTPPPLGANVKSFVWYSPKMFKDKGYEVPTTWDELIALSDKIVADNPGNIKPWCAGIESGDATGWPATDWIEDIMLRTAGPRSTTSGSTTRSRSTTRVATALDRGRQDPEEPQVRQRRLRRRQDDRHDVLPGRRPADPRAASAHMHRQAIFYAANWPEGHQGRPTTATSSPSTCRPSTPSTKPVLGGGEFVAAFADRPEVQAFQTYLASTEWANERAKTCGSGGCVTRQQERSTRNLDQPDRQALGRDPQDPKAVVPLRRFRPDAGARSARARSGRA